MLPDVVTDNVAISACQNGMRWKAAHVLLAGMPSKALEADPTEVLVGSVANSRALLTLAFRSLSNSVTS